MARDNQRETDLDKPVRRFFTDAGYLVHGEVSDCDLVAFQPDHDTYVAIELKQALNLAVILQATQRQRLCAEVWIAVPHPGRFIRNRHWQHLLHLLRRLELGLLLVSLDRTGQPVEAALLPQPMDRIQTVRRNRRRLDQLKREFNGRHQDLNQGGSRGPRMTVYREQALLVAALLHQAGSASARQLRQNGGPDKTWQILYHNHYGWFERLGSGSYQLTGKGLQSLQQHPDLIRQLLGDRVQAGLTQTGEHDSVTD